MTFKVTELMTPNLMLYCSMGCGPTIYDGITSFCTWVTEDATGYHDGQKKARSEEGLALLKADLRRATAVH